MGKTKTLPEVDELLADDDARKNVLLVLEKTAELFQESGLLSPDSSYIFDRRLGHYAAAFGIEIPAQLSHGRNHGIGSFCKVPVKYSPERSVFEINQHSGNPEELGGNFVVQLDSGLIIKRRLAKGLGLNVKDYPARPVDYVSLPFSVDSDECYPSISDALVHWKDKELGYLKQVFGKFEEKRHLGDGLEMQITINYATLSQILNNACHEDNPVRYFTMTERMMDYVKKNLDSIEACALE